MPFYEYQCTDCDHRLEVLQKISDARLVDCPECSAPKLKKLISAAAFRLKGTGWYETDFKNGQKKDDSGDKKESKPETAAAKDAGSESSGKSAPDSTSGSKTTGSASTSSATKSDSSGSSGSSSTKSESKAST